MRFSFGIEVIGESSVINFTKIIYTVKDRQVQENKATKIRAVNFTKIIYTRF